MIDPVADPSDDDVSRWHRTFAPRFFNRTWELMDRGDLDGDERDEMLTSAFAQRAHWYAVGNERNRAIADWQVSRAAVLAGYPNLARHFGDRSLREAQDLDPFVAAFAHEAIARAAALVDDVATFEMHFNAARELATRVEDDDDRRVLIADLDQMVL